MNKKLNKYFLSIVLFIPLLITSCSDVPGSLGDELVSAKNVDVSVLLDSTSVKDTNLVIHSALGSASTILLGLNSEVEAVTLLKFVPTISGALDTLKKNQIVVDTALVTLTRVYQLAKNESDAFDYNAYSITNDWSSTEVNTDSIATKVQISGNNIITRHVSDDTVSSRFHINKDLVLQWMRAALDTNAGVAKNYGFMLKPAPSTKKIIGYEAITSSYVTPPSLHIAYRYLNNDTVKYLDVNCDADAHSVRLLDSTKYANEKIILLQNGVIKDARLWYDISNLPKDIIVHSCVLTLTKKTDSPYNFTGTTDYISDIRAYYLKDSAAMTVNTSLLAKFSITDNNYTADITNIFASFLSEKKNVNIGLFSASRFYGADAVTFYSSKADNLAQRPRLKIIYSKGSN